MSQQGTASITNNDCVQPSTIDTTDSSIVTLSVGGVLFTTLKETLCTRIKKYKKQDEEHCQEQEDEYYPEHMLSVMLKGSFKLLKDSKENIFINRNPTYFGYILEYLRAEGIKGLYMLPSTPVFEEESFDLKSLYIEAHYFQIQGLIEELELMMPSLKIMSEPGKYFPDTHILNYNHIFRINNWLGDVKQEWKLLWQGTRDGFDPKTFHTKCDNKGPTIIIIKTSCGSIIGGYTSVNWTSNGNIATTFYDPNAFFFSLKTPQGNLPYIYNPSPVAIVCNSKFGPTFAEILVVENNRTFRFKFASVLNFIDEIEVYCKK